MLQHHFPCNISYVVISVSMGNSLKYTNNGCFMNNHLRDLGILTGDTGRCPLLVPMSPDIFLAAAPSFLVDGSRSVVVFLWVGLCGIESLSVGLCGRNESFCNWVGLCRSESFWVGLCGNESFRVGLCGNESFRVGLCGSESS